MLKVCAISCPTTNGTPIEPVLNIRLETFIGDNFLMSIPRKGSRKIIIDDEPFIWLIPKPTKWQIHYPYGYYLHMVVEHAEEPASLLVIKTNLLHPVDSSYIRDGEITPITPSDVALWVKHAIKLGWLPKQADKSFRIRVVNECVGKIDRD